MLNFEILNRKEIIEILDNFKNNINSKKNYKFNIFTISSYGSHLENFHSDIIAELIDPIGAHKENNLLLNTFIDFLNLKGANISNKSFNNAIIKREKGRIDIAIYNNKNEVIIIENKINGAIDTDNQLKNYYNWCINQGYKVISIIYLTLSGEKMAPSFKSVKTKTINIIAFSNSKEDLINGWIIPSIGKCTNFDTASFLKQYSKLLIYLTYDKMNSEIYDKFYEISDDMSVVNKINELKKISDQLPKIRMDKLVKKLKNFQPFTKSYRYKPHYMLYEKFNENDNSFKLDIWFETNGSGQIHFWNTKKNGEDAFISVQEKLIQIGYENKMTESRENWIGYYKRFNFSDFNSIKKLDEVLLNFVKDMMNKLNNTNA